MYRLWVCLLAVSTAFGAVEFNRDIRPILSDRCFSCHGPDAISKKIRLRLDSESGMTADLGGKKAVVPGQPDQSELIRRVTTENKALRMPPAYTNLKLTDRETQLLKSWISEGAKFQKHWSFVTPTRPPAPPVRNTAWVKNAIDPFVLARLERENLQPAPEAEKATLIRRVTLDLTGLPPTLAEVDAFLNDSSPNAYEKVVDRLLASPRYGERMAARWLDVARYADTNGYQTDAERFMWRWRDWVINAFNRNKPFDQFTVEQLAGDLLPNPTLDQKIATGFNRNHRGNGEGGIIPEEYAVEYVADRVETTSTVWLGLTMTCARCHSHKYDPLTQKEYYQLFAYFNNIPERGRYFKYGNTPPLIPAPTPDQEGKLKDVESRLAAAEQVYRRMEGDARQAQMNWEASLPAAAPADWFLTRGQIAHRNLDSGSSPGRYGNAAKFDGKSFLDGGTLGEFSFTSNFTISLWVNPASPNGAILSRSKDASEEAGLAIFLNEGRIQVSAAARWLDDALRVETEQPLKLNEWQHVVMTYDGTRIADGIRLYVNGKLQSNKVILDELNQEFKTGDPWRIGGGLGMRFTGLMDDIRTFGRTLNPNEVAMLAIPANLNQIAAIPAANRSQAQKDKLRLAFLEQFAPPSIRDSWAQFVTARETRDRVVAAFPTVMIMEEIPKPRDAFLLVRGSYEKPSEKVQRAVPASLHPLPKDAPPNRLGLARWIVDPANPLTARVIVNRFWQSYFGIGIVKTVEDFGSQGEWPSHLDLLDWLATEFIQSGWDVKAMQKTIVMSATYRQSSKASNDLVQRDPENRLLARGPRMRLSAEMVRDQALAISGLYVERIGGPSVKPYQPAGLWKELTGGADYQRDSGPDLYRRSLYTFWKRTAPPPMMMNFDSPSRETCIVRESRTNTPLQALNLMNDVTYLESARKMAERMIREGGDTPENRIAFGIRLATARSIRPAESKVLLDSYRYQRDYYQTNRDAAVKYLTQGESPRDEKLDPSELAAYATVASMILNLDEVISKQ